MAVYTFHQSNDIEWEFFLNKPLRLMYNNIDYYGTIAFVVKEQIHIAIRFEMSDLGILIDSRKLWTNPITFVL